MRVLLVLCCLGLLAGVSPAAAQDTFHWKKRAISVLDYTGPELAGYVPRVVDAWNAVDAGQPHLVYERREQALDCGGVQEQKGVIVVCNIRQNLMPDCNGWGEASGCASLHYGREKRHNRGFLNGAFVVLAAGAYDTHSSASGHWWQPLGCHELGHALGLQHPKDWSQDTCLGVQRDTPGTKDVADLKRLYRHTKGKR